MTHRLTIVLVELALILGAPLQGRAAPSVEVGKVRIQLLSPTLVRLEERGPQGFEDRPTFLVVERNWPGTAFSREEEGGATIIRTKNYAVRVPTGGPSLGGVEVQSASGELLYRVEGALPARPRFPAPSDLAGAFVVADSPRVVPPAWGATPPPDGAAMPVNLVQTSGWELGNDAPDVYVFINAAGYAALRKEFLRLTGPIPLPPKFVLGFWNSRYHPYTEQEALGDIDRYRREGIPLDVFVVDTDWRVGGSGGYDVETRCFPDMARFLREAHSRHVKVMFNDHPQPNGMQPLEPKMLRFRWEGLTKLLGMGLDFWWFDRNWHDVIPGPTTGIATEEWGQRLYYDIEARFRPSERPLLMSMCSSQPSSHRYPIWWTGDIRSDWPSYRKAIADSVGYGVRLLPWVNEDLGGFVGDPDPEFYVRFLEYGCLSPVARVHCNRGRIRYPWAFGEEAQTIVTDYIKLRYRLMPTLYAAARRAYDDGTPILRRCDLEWPAIPEAQDNSQYLLGDDLLVAPALASKWGSEVPLPTDLLRTPTGEPGLRAEYFANARLEGQPVLVRTDAILDFAWDASPGPGLDKERFSVRWTGWLGPIPATGEARFVTVTDDGVRLWLDGKLIINNWTSHDVTTDRASAMLEAGKSYDVKLEYFQGGGGAVCRLAWIPPLPEEPTGSSRSVWIPPGVWEDAWTGEQVSGPRKLDVVSPLWHTPMYMRRGGIVLLAPAVQYTGEKPWDPVTVEAFAGRGAQGRVVREFYEDDGSTTGYQKGECARTQIELAQPEPGRVALTIQAVNGDFHGRQKKRAWIVRIHLAPGEKAGTVTVDGKAVRVLGAEPADPGKPSARVLLPATAVDADAPLAMPFCGAGARPGPRAGPVVEVRLPAADTRHRHSVSVTVK